VLKLQDFAIYSKKLDKISFGAHFGHVVPIQLDAVKKQKREFFKHLKSINIKLAYKSGW